MWTSSDMFEIIPITVATIIIGINIWLINVVIIFIDTNIIKNAVGTLGVIGTIFIAAVPLIRVGLTTLFIYLISGLAEIVADEKIVYVLEQMGDSCKVLLASITTVVIMLIIGFTITMKLGVPS